MLKTLPTTAHSIHAVRARALPELCPAFNAIASGLQSRLGSVPTAGFIAASILMQLAAGSLKAEVRDVSETATFRSPGNFEYVAGMQARKLANGGLFVFAAPDGESMIAGWLLSNLDLRQNVFPIGALSENSEFGRNSPDQAPADSLGVAPSRFEFQTSRSRRPENDCECMSFLEREPSANVSSRRADGLFEVGVPGEKETCPTGYSPSGSLSSIGGSSPELKELGTYPSFDLDALYDSREEQPLLLDATSEIQLLAEIRSDSFWFTLGSRDAPPVYAFLDPGCPYCTKAVLRLRDEVEGGRVQLRVILVSGAGSRSSDLVAGVLEHRDPPAAFWRHMIAMGTFGSSDMEPGDFGSLNAELRSAVELNRALLKRARAPGVPFFLFDSANGVQTIVGVPEPGTFKNAL